MFSFICAWINRWVNNGEAGDLRRYHAHYDVIVIGDSHFKTVVLELMLWITFRRTSREVDLRWMPRNTVDSLWRHQMETFSALLAICAGNSPLPVNSPHKGQWRGALMFTLICAPINGWVNNREAGDLRRYRAHYDVIVMLQVNNDLAPTRWQPTIWTNDGLVYWLIYASLGFSE